MKIDPANIGVGMYQHDVKAKHLRESLDAVVESCVNFVGVDLNTASPALLRYVSGLNQLTAQRLVSHRMTQGPFTSRAQLRSVLGFGEAAFVQAAGFLKIVGGDNPLDATWIHPGKLCRGGTIAGEAGLAAGRSGRQSQGAELAERLAGADLAELATKRASRRADAGRHRRPSWPGPVATRASRCPSRSSRKGILKLDDLAPGMELMGTVLNVVDFGAFVDIGLKDSGLVHVSQLATKFIQDPHDCVSVGDIVTVWVMAVDKERRRVSLTMIDPASRRTGDVATDARAPRPNGRPEEPAPLPAPGDAGGQPRRSTPGGAASQWAAFGAPDRWLGPQQAQAACAAAAQAEAAARRPAHQGHGRRTRAAAHLRRPEAVLRPEAPGGRSCAGRRD